MELSGFQTGRGVSKGPLKVPQMSPKGPPTVDRRPSTVDRRPSTVDRLLSTGDRRPSTIDRRPATVDRRPSTADRRPSTVDRFSSWVPEGSLAKNFQHSRTCRCPGSSFFSAPRESVVLESAARPLCTHTHQGPGSRRPEVRALASAR